MTKNKINFRHLNDDTTIPLHLYLPTMDSYNNLRYRIEVMAMRIIKEHLPSFSDCDVAMHIGHQYSHGSAKTSKIVSIQPIITISAG